ncbi:MAG: helix-hairpin-helix domain-containing protein [Bryobacteraceae bacterium]
MKIRHFFIVALCAAAALSEETASRGGQETGPAGGKEAFQKLCVTCHKAEVVLASRRTRSQWEDTLEKMIAKGAKGSDDDFILALDYLVATHGRVNMNNATANEIIEIAGLPREQAEAIVKHRRANGRFEDFDALLKVPGLDAKRLEAVRDAISF